MLVKKHNLFAGVIAAMTLLTIGTANAQTPTFGVQAIANTSGYNGTYPDNPGPVMGGKSASAASDPAGLQYNNGYGLVYGDAGAHANAYTHSLYANVDAYADRITATAFPNSSPAGDTESRYWDYITVRSGSLPNGTVVEVVFRNAHITNWNASGVYSGSVYSEIKVGGYSASTNSKMDSTWGTTEVPGPELRARLTVGSRYSLQSKLRLYGRAFYFTQGPIYDGVIHIDTTSNVEMDPLGQDVTLQFDSDL
ncbi:MAG TPA: hypothetical protein VH394_13685 [Thermoanaerobaculia bacterium]|jgi:hypothetical protein|nr:hypothetical protein [Thermoanaerobaculia bacterium]